MKNNDEYRELLESLSSEAFFAETKGGRILVKNCADRQPGRLDPRTAKALEATRDGLTNRPWEYDPCLVRNVDKLCGPEEPRKFSLLERMRFQFGWNTEDLSPEVERSRLRFQTPEGEVTVWRYALPDVAPKAPAMVFVHGGGFAAGDVAMSENQCRLLAKLIGGVSFSVDYPLCPEVTASQIVSMVYAVLCELHDQSQAYGLDPDRIAIGGDSAGGNIALLCCLRARDEGKKPAFAQMLIYPLLSRAERPDQPGYFWNEAAYDNPSNCPAIAQACEAIGESLAQINAWSLSKNEEPGTPGCSPFFAEAKGLVPTLLLMAEYDFLRVQCEEYLSELVRAGVPVRAVRYGGIFHGSFDRLGYAPQTEDMVREMAACYEHSVKDTGFWFDQ